MKDIDCSKRENARSDKCKRQVGEGFFTMILPKADNSSNKIKPDRFNSYISRINSRFGGSTTKPITLGCWKDEKRNKLNCETGFAIETFRDFDGSDLDAIERKNKLEEDDKFLNDLAQEAANEFGQDSVPVIYDNIVDVKLNKGMWRKDIEKEKLTGKKIKGNLFKKYI